MDMYKYIMRIRLQVARVMSRPLLLESVNDAKARVLKVT